MASIWLCGLNRKKINKRNCSVLFCWEDANKAAHLNDVRWKGLDQFYLLFIICIEWCLSTYEHLTSTIWFYFRHVPTQTIQSNYLLLITLSWYRLHLHLRMIMPHLWCTGIHTHICTRNLCSWRKQMLLLFEVTMKSWLSRNNSVDGPNLCNSYNLCNEIAVHEVAK